jgi:hypothetical protein
MGRTLDAIVKTFPLSFVLIVMFVSLIFSMNAFVDFAGSMSEIHKAKKAGSISIEQVREKTAGAYIDSIGNSAGWLATFFSSIAVACGFATMKLNRWWWRLIPLLTLGGVFYLSTHAFLMGEELMEFLSLQARAEILDQIVAVKRASIFVGLVSGGLIYECGKDFVGIK